MSIVDTISAMTEAPWFTPAAVLSIAAFAFMISVRRAREQRQLKRAAEIESRLRD